MESVTLVRAVWEPSALSLNPRDIPPPVCLLSIRQIIAITRPVTTAPLVDRLVTWAAGHRSQITLQRKRNHI